MRFRKIIFCLLCIIIIPSSALFSEVRDGFIHINNAEGLYSTAGMWHFRYGDDLKWAGSGFIQSEWDRAKVPSWVEPAPGKTVPGWFWYRLHFTIDERVIEEKPLFISIPRVFHAYEIYLNGKKIGSRGSLPDDDGNWFWSVGGISIIVTPGTLYTDKDNVLAIRAYGGYRHFAGTMYNYGFIGSYNYKRSFYWLSNIQNFLLGIIAVIIGLYHLVWFKSRNRDLINFIFGLCSLSLGFFYFFVWLPDTVSSSDTRLIHSLHVSFLVLAHMLLVAFFYFLYQDRFKRFKRPIFLFTLFELLLAISITVSQYFPLVNFSLYGIILLMLFSSPVTLYLIYSDPLRKENGSVLMLPGVIILVVFAFIDIMQILYTEFIPTPDFLWLISPFGLIIFDFFASLYIRKRDKWVNGIERTADKDDQELPVRAEKKSYLKGIDAEELNGHLTDLMKEEKKYRDDNLTLNSLAALLDITSHQLSEFLNERLNMNFNTFVNSYRIEEAKQILIGEPDSSITSIAYKVGFNSISSFYKFFKDETGMKPKEYRRQNINHTNINI